MRETWRWYGPSDPISLQAIRETVARGVVTALYHVAPDRAWKYKEIMALKGQIEAAGLTWDVVESIPVPNSVKLGNAQRGGGIETCLRTLSAVADAGIGTVCYNFMPTFDGTRSSTRWLTRTGLATRFNSTDFAVYDLFLLQREGTRDTYPDALCAAPGNDTLDLFAQFSHRVNFLHLRNVTIDGPGSFFEDEHLVGQTDLAALAELMLREERRRLAQGRGDAIIPMRPDHGHLTERDADLGAPHGYAYVGRLKGLADLRGVATALDARLA
ncbi:MAG: mannonate dehydratase [Pseudomonadota bacterium]